MIGGQVEIGVHKKKLKSKDRGHEKNGVQKGAMEMLAISKYFNPYLQS